MVDWGKWFGKRSRAKPAVRSRKYLYKLIWLTCIAVCIPVILASTVYHYIAMARMERYILSRSDASLLLLKDRA